MPICVPHETEGGPCHPKKRETNTTYWVADTTYSNQYFEVHWHKSESVPVLNWILTPIVKGIRSNKGDITVDPYRILIKVGEPWSCIASSESYTDIITDFKWLTATLVPRLMEEESKLSRKLTATEIEDFIFPTLLSVVVGETKKHYFKSTESKEFVEWQKRIEAIRTSESFNDLEKLKK